MKFFEDRSDVFAGGSTGKEAGSGVSDVLEPFEESGSAIEQTVAVINAGSHKCVGEGFSGLRGKVFVETGNVRR